MNYKITIPALLACALCLSPLSAALVEIDNFDTVTTGTQLSDVSGWTFVGGQAEDAPVTNTGSDTYVEMNNQATYQRTLTGSEIATAADGLSAFSVTTTLTDSTDAYRSFTVILAEPGGVNALSINFNGGGIKRFLR